ncbi:thiol protease/hemagglutinin PrtT [Apibacter raozihei]|uniref:thiol protease/hemagglutinin PrtT n=1 Tax=Apibacter raozihei TaxID=2500547 RepID=UPI000FE3AF80|nr:thiol protease/hemagglutinin PrtT [Apibacter raozihei]
MKNKLLLFLFVLQSAFAFGKQIPIDEAILIAQKHQSQSGTSLSKLSIPVQLVKTVQGNINQKSTREPSNLYYIFNKGYNKGYVIVAADDVSVPVIGYTTEGTYDESLLPPNYLGWIKSVEQGIEQAILEGKEASDKVKRQWTTFSNSKNLATYSLYNTVTPLIKTKWDQLAPYYNSIPVKDANGNSALTGCIATAMAQILKYYEFPKKGYKIIPGYRIDYLNITMPSIDITQHVYDWDNMLNIYKGNSSNPNQNKAVADLMYHCGVAVQMGYGFAASASVSELLPNAFTYFGYTTSKLIYRDNFSDEAWSQILINSFENRQPVYYAGGGHAFICDGYDSDGLFHFNWGWSGSADGYYSIDAILYAKNESMLYEIKPKIYSAYHRDDKEELRKIMSQGDNYLTLGLSVADTLKWRSSEEWVTKVKGVTWKEGSEGKRISKLNWTEGTPKLSGSINLEPFAEVEEVLTGHNDISSLTIQNTKLKHIDTGHNNISTLNVGNCLVLNTLLIDYNELKELNISNCSLIDFLLCNNNKLKFSALPLKNISIIAYANQNKDLITIIAGKTIDLSKEYNIDNHITSYKWYAQDGKEISLSTAGNGKFIADAKYANTILTCKMTNSRFPDLILESSYFITADSTYNEEDKEGLRQFLQQGDNFYKLGLSASDKDNWEGSEEWVDKVNGITWIDTNQGKRIFIISWASKNLTGTLNVSKFKEIWGLFIQQNQINGLIALKNQKLEYIDAGSSKLSTLRIEDCTKLISLLVHVNELTELHVSDYKLLKNFFCNGNKLKFSDLPLENISNFQYSDQAKIDGGSIGGGQIVDLSKEYNIDSHITSYKWYAQDGKEISLSAVGNGKFMADTKYLNTTLTCKMTNSRFPNLKLEYSVKVIGVYNEEDKEGLRQFLQQKDNFSKVGLSTIDKNNWNSSEEWVAKVIGIKWKDTDQGKRIHEISWYGKGLTGVLDITRFKGIWGLFIVANQIDGLIATQNQTLEYIDAGVNKLTTLRINDCSKLKSLLVHGSELSELNVSSYKLFENFFCYGNKLRFSDLPLENISWMLYNNQAKINGGTLEAGQIIDLSKEYNIDNHITSYKWYTQNGKEINLSVAGNGKFMADAKYANTTLACKMTNSRFPNLILEYTVRVTRMQAKSYLDEVYTTDISVYPNPTADVLYFNTTVKVDKVNIYSLDGKMIKQISDVHNNKIDVQFLSSGVYIIIIDINSEHLMKRFTKI